MTGISVLPMQRFQQQFSDLPIMTLLLVPSRRYLATRGRKISICLFFCAVSNFKSHLVSRPFKSHEPCCLPWIWPFSLQRRIQKDNFQHIRRYLINQRNLWHISPLIEEIYCSLESPLNLRKLVPGQMLKRKAFSLERLFYGIWYP